MDNSWCENCTFLQLFILKSWPDVVRAPYAHLDAAADPCLRSHSRGREGTGKAGNRAETGITCSLRLSDALME